MSFAKLDHGIVKSSIWSEPLATRILWISMLAIKDENGFVSASRSGMARIANITMDDFEIGIKCLESPDPDSRTTEYDGRRIEKVEGGWIILNHEKYRLHDDIQRDKTRERVRRYRERCNAVTECNVTNTLPSVSVSVSDVLSVSPLSVNNKGLSIDSDIIDKAPIGEQQQPAATTWRDSYDAYMADLNAAVDRLSKDRTWMHERERFNPGLNINESLSKALTEFWATEAGWKHKKSKKSKEIDWSKTFINALSLKCNKVYFQKKEGKYGS